jgi:adenine-specific DNA-methyltransferase
MGVCITYMGTKREVAPAVRAVIETCQKGPLLDAFSGMCAVGEEVAPSRQIWTNDAQVFASEVATALFTSRDEPPSAIWAADLHYAAFNSHRVSLLQRFLCSLDMEEKVVAAETFRQFEPLKTKLATSLSREISKIRRRRGNLFVLTYADAYFGVRQAIEIDSVRRSIDINQLTGKITTDQRRWLLVALGRALLKVANSTGHFAQFLKPKVNTFKRYIQQRRRSVWAEWLFSIGEQSAVGTLDWRKRNRAFNQDTLSLLPTLYRYRDKPSVIYADPPYTDDQYSRYYHILETMLAYDYPVASGAGLYRPGRFVTPFSSLTHVVHAFHTLVRRAARTGADFVLSYPNNGLLHKAGADPRSILRTYFRTARCCCEIPHNHSTFGASKGTASSQVVESVYLAKP